MKKTLAILVALVLVLSAGITAFAAPGSFVQSPSRNKAPILVDFSNTSHDCFASLFITAYADRDKLDADSKQKMEDAYSSIAKTTDLGNLCADLHTIAADKGIASIDMAITDLFDIDYISCDTHNQHGKFSIKLSAETLDKFVALIQRVDNQWVVVDSAAIEGEYLTFETQDLSTYAIVVNTQGMVIPDDGEGDFPPTGVEHNYNSTATYVYLGIALVSAASLAGVLIGLRKKSR